MNSAAKIRTLNDAFRKRGEGTGRVHLTAGVAAYPWEQQAEIMQRVHRFNAFGTGNDPFGEHDFGMFRYAGKALIWKIDYYDRQVEFGSSDPSDEAVTTRVLTIMLAEEY
jgi:hypothetical protein